MTVALRGTTASGPNDGPSQSSSRATNVPAGSAAGDVAVLISEIWRNGTTPTVTFPAGFTQFFDQTITIPSNGVLYLRMAWKRLTGADSGTYTATYSATVWNLLHCVTVSGAASTGDPVEATNFATATSTTIPSLSLSSVTQPFLLHSVATFNDATQTPPTGFTEDQDGTVLHTNHRIPGATGTHTASGGTISASTQMVVGLVAIAADGGSTALTVADATQGQTAGTVALTQVHILAVAGATQSHTAESPGLVQNSILSVQPAAQAQTSSTVTLTQVHQLAVDDAAHAQTADVVSLAGTSSLSVNDAAMAQTSTTVTLTQTHSLTVADATQTQAATSVAFTQVHALTVSSAAQGMSSDTVTFTTGGSLSVQDATHAQSTGAVNLTQQHSLAVAGAVQQQTSGLVELTQLHLLQPDPALHPHQADTVLLVAIGEYTSADFTTATVRRYYTTAVARPVTATAVIRSPAATAEVRSTDEAG